MGPAFWSPQCTAYRPRKKLRQQIELEVCRLLKIDKTRTSPYHPQGNGQVERHNRVLADMISKYCADNPRPWDTMLLLDNFVYNTTIHRTTGATPFSLVYGQECQYPIDLFYPKPHDEPRNQKDFVEWLDETFREAHANARELLGVNQRRQKDLYHKKVFGNPFYEGEKVWLFAKHKSKSRKFFLPWEGPYEVLERTSEVNYKISKPNSPTKWKIVHFNLLKPFKEEDEEEETDLAPPPRVTPYRSRDFFNDPGVLVDEDEEEPPMVGRRQLRSDTKARKSHYAGDQPRLDWQLNESNEDCEVQLLFIEEIKIEPEIDQPQTDQHHQMQDAGVGNDNHDRPTMENVEQSGDTGDHREVENNDRGDEGSAVEITDNHQDNGIGDNQSIAQRRPIRNPRPIARLGINE